MRTVSKISVDLLVIVCSETYQDVTVFVVAAVEQIAVVVAEDFEAAVVHLLVVLVFVVAVVEEIAVFVAAAVAQIAVAEVAEVVLKIVVVVVEIEVVVL